MQARFSRKLGVALMLGSGVMWAAIVIVPFLPIANGAPAATVIAQKALVTTCLAIGSEVVFWVGILLVGKELAQSYRQKLNPYYWWQQVMRRRF